MDIIDLSLCIIFLFIVIIFWRKFESKGDKKYKQCYAEEENKLFVEIDDNKIEGKFDTFYSEMEIRINKAIEQHEKIYHKKG